MALQRVSGVIAQLDSSKQRHSHHWGDNDNDPYPLAYEVIGSVQVEDLTVSASAELSGPAGVTD
jgi:hypothetical protein